MDVGSQKEVPFVQVELKSRDQKIVSNGYGEFLFKLSPSQAQGAFSYSFFDNYLLWEGDQQIGLELFGLDGRSIATHSNLGNKGSFLFPKLLQGIYLLRLSSPASIYTFKVFSDGRKTTAVDPAATWHRSPKYPGNDTLYINKEGYLPREIVLPKKDSSIQIALLKENYSDLQYFNQLLNPLAFNLLSSNPSRTHHGGVKSVKIIYNSRDRQMYYINTKAFSLHYEFAWKVLGFKGGNGLFNHTQYLENPDRYLYPANLNYYPAIDKYVLQLVAGNQIDCEHIELLYNKLIETSFMKGKLFFFANKPEWQACEGVPTINSDELFQGQNYQALNLTEGFGYLRKINIDSLETSYLGRRDIVLLNGIPNDVSVVAGIITTEFQTPLSHINVLSNTRGTPNMAFAEAWNNTEINALVNKLVYLKVEEDTFKLREASISEAEAFWQRREPQTITVLPKSTDDVGLISLHSAGYQDVFRIGGKAANFAEMLKIRANDGSIPTPESSFAIPFSYYHQHMLNSGLDQRLEELLNNTQFKSDPAFRKKQLETFQEAIRNHPLDPGLVKLVKQQINNFSDFPAFRFRSSTNAEDLEDFSGAGLYNSYSAKKGHQKKTIENAIRKVWASLWNYRAFEERSYFKIDHGSCAMGILVHRSFPDEDANGVLITRNLYNNNPGFIINVQHKEESIVFPEPGVLHDQIMLMAWSNIPGQAFMIEYLSYSNLPALKGMTVMTDEEIFELGTYAMSLKRHYFQNTTHNCQCAFNDFALDIEFKVDSQVSPREIYLKQVRLFK